MPFIPTQAVLHKLIEKSTQIKAKGEILYMINPKEKKRVVNELDLSEPVNEIFQKLRILPMPIKYPTLEDYPAFYEQTNLMHLAEKYKPDGFEAHLNADLKPWQVK